MKLSMEVEVIVKVKIETELKSESIALKTFQKRVACEATRSVVKALENAPDLPIGETNYNIRLSKSRMSINNEIEVIPK